jgi:hypothetical protein
MRTVVLASLLASAASFKSPAFRPRVASRAIKLNAVTPHGGTLVDLFSGFDKTKEQASCTKTIQLNARQMCDVELICNGFVSYS